jgi:hypothetical protein
VEAVVLGSVDIFIQFRPRVDPYFLLPMSNPLVGWQKVWFFLGMRPTRRSPCSWVAAPSLNPNGGMGWPRKTSASYNPCVMSSNSCYEVG